MRIITTGFDGLLGLVPARFADDRGWFTESYRKSALAAAGINCEFPQDNLSWSRKGVLRGLHFQKDPFAQAKLVRVFSGRVLDVVVDIRPSSPTFGKHYRCELTAEEGNMLFVPEGFAHGFRALEDSLFSYKCSAEYLPAADSGIRWSDAKLGIDWGLAAGEIPLVSAKDQALPGWDQVIGEILQ